MLSFYGRGWDTLYFKEEQERSRVKRGWREHITLVSLLSGILADLGSSVFFFFFFCIYALHSFWHLIDEKNPVDVTSEVKIIIVITAIASNVSIETGAMTEAFHKYLYSTNLTRKGLSNILHSGEPKAHRVWFCAEIHKAGKWHQGINSCSKLL